MISYDGIPPNSQTFTAPNGQTFLAPGGTNFQDVYNDGKEKGILGVDSAIYGMESKIFNGTEVMVGKALIYFIKNIKMLQITRRVCT